MYNGYMIFNPKHQKAIRIIMTFAAIVIILSMVASTAIYGLL